MSVVGFWYCVCPAANVLVAVATCVKSCVPANGRGFFAFFGSSFLAGVAASFFGAPVLSVRPVAGAAAAGAAAGSAGAGSAAGGVVAAGAAVVGAVSPLCS